MTQLQAQNKFAQNALKYGFSLYGPAPTGQTLIYYAGDDGTYKKGYPRQGARFTNNGDGTITDNATGLTWIADPGALGGVWGSSVSPTWWQWSAGIGACLELEFAGKSDWRMPNIKELSSIVDHGRESTPLIDTDFFTCQDDFYWSSTTFRGSPTNKRYVNFNSGNNSYAGASTYHYVRPVRGGYPVG